MTKKALNGSTDLLAKAMRTVFKESVEGAVEPLRKDLKNLDKKMDKGFSKVDKEITKVKQQVAKVDKQVAAVSGELAYARKEGELTR